MNKKQKKMARRIAIGGGLFLLGLILKQFVPYVGEVFMVAAWLAAGHEVLRDAFEKIKAKKPFDEDELIEMAELFKMFGDSTRIKILSVLFGGEQCVQEITEATCASQSAVSHQLRLLKQARLVRCRRSGKQIYYSLADDHVKTILGMAKEHLEE